MKIQSTLGVTLALVSAALLAAVSYLAFIFPRTLQVWQEEYADRSLSALQRLVANASHFCQAFGLVLLPLLALTLVGTCVWMGVAARGREAANNHPGA
jgi:type II secretory pathway component PulF